MTKQQSQQLLIVALLIVLGVVWAWNRRSQAPLTIAGRPGQLAGSTAFQAETAPPREELAREPSLARDFFRWPNLLRNRIQIKESSQKPQPVQTQVPREVLPDLSQFNLQGLFWGISKPQALINRKRVSVGDTIEGARVVGISKEGVTLSIGQKEFLLEPAAPIRSGSKSKQSRPAGTLPGMF